MDHNLPKGIEDGERGGGGGGDRELGGFGVWLIRDGENMEW